MPQGKFFFIRHVMSGLVLEVDQSRDKVGTPVVTAYQLPITEARDHQLWFLDPSTSTIRNKLNNQCLDIKGRHV